MFPWKWIHRRWVFVVNLIGAISLSLNSLAYALWRPHNPPDNPGGPLARMGEAYVTWSSIAMVSPMLSVLCWVQVAAFLGGRFTARYGRPPEIEEALSSNPRQDTIGVLMAMPLVLGIAVYLATHPPAGPFGGLVLVGLIFLAFTALLVMVPSVQHELLRWLEWLRTCPWRSAPISEVPTVAEPVSASESAPIQIVSGRRSSDN